MKRPTLLALVLLPFAMSAAPDQLIAYKTVAGLDGAEVELKLHIFNPEGHSVDDERGAIVFFFGGGWNGGTPGQFYPHSEYLASRGMVAIAAEYRTKKGHGSTPTLASKTASPPSAGCARTRPSSASPPTKF